MPEPIDRILEHFLNPERAWVFGYQVQRAITEFSGEKGPMSPDGFEHFLDWFLFNFEYQPGETPLAYSLRANPLKFTDAELVQLREIIERNHFGYFEVLASRRDGMTFKGVEDGESYEIADTEAAPESRAGDVFLCRIAPVGGVWRVVNTSALALRPTARDWRRIRAQPLRDSREAYREIVLDGTELPDLSTLDVGGGQALISSGAEGWSPEEDDDCAICRLMRQAKAEGREPSRPELMRAFREANASPREKRGKKRGR